MLLERGNFQNNSLFMKKLLAIIVLGLLWSGNAYALNVSCKLNHKGEKVLASGFDLSKGSEWNPEYTNNYIFWRVFKVTKESEAKAKILYYRLDRYSGDLLLRVSYEENIKKLLGQNRKNTSIDFALNGDCKKGGKKKF